MRVSFRYRLPALLVIAALVIGACTGAATPAPTSSPTSAPSTAAQTATATTLPGSKTFSIVSSGTWSFSAAPLLAALDSMKSQGYTIDMPSLQGPELATQGLADGSFQFAGSVGPNTVMALVAKGAGIKTIMSRNANEIVVYGRSATIKTCADLSGKRVAVHSEASTAYSMLKAWVKEKCPTATPNYLIIPGSDNRLVALLADQIDAAPLELNDSITLDTKAGDRFKLLVSFAEELALLQNYTMGVNAKFATENPGTVVALIKATLTEYRRIAGDAAALRADAEKYVKDMINPDTVAAISKKYTDLKIFDVNGGLTQQSLQFTTDFYGPNGTKDVPTAVSISQWADLSFLDMALKDLGRK